LLLESTSSSVVCFFGFVTMRVSHEDVGYPHCEKALIKFFCTRSYVHRVHSFSRNLSPPAKQAEDLFVTGLEVTPNFLLCILVMGDVMCYSWLTLSYGSNSLCPEMWQLRWHVVWDTDPAKPRFYFENCIQNFSIAGLSLLLPSAACKKRSSTTHFIPG
jgi:hypothetical protein